MLPSGYTSGRPLGEALAALELKLWSRSGWIPGCRTGGAETALCLELCARGVIQNQKVTTEMHKLAIDVCNANAVPR